MNGVFALYKEKGYTSFDTVAILRGILHERKIGHAGTLDPAAEGVLVIVCGSATKLVDYFNDEDKSYEAKLLLGVTTDTQDMTGEILSRRSVAVSEEELSAVLENFRGDIRQIPPMYSAVQIDGKRLYDLARKGKTVERKPRNAHISELTVIDTSLPSVSLRVTCSKGTYIRTLCNDIGEALGCGGAMVDLLRIRSGAFTLKDAKTLDGIREAVRRGDLSFVHPVDEFFPDCPKIYVGEEYAALLVNGNPLPKDLCRMYPGILRFRMYLPDGKFIGIYARRDGKGRIYPEKIFPDETVRAPHADGIPKNPVRGMEQ